MFEPETSDNVSCFEILQPSQIQEKKKASFPLPTTQLAPATTPVKKVVDSEHKKLPVIADLGSTTAQNRNLKKKQFAFFGLHLSFPTFTFLFFGFLVQPFPSPATSSRSHLLRMFSSCMAPCSQSKRVSVFSGKDSSVFQQSLLGDVPQPFFSHETSHLKLFPEPSALLPGDPSFVPFN